MAGNVYGFTITDNRTGEIVENVGGFYGEEGIECIKSEFREYVSAFEIKDYPLFAFSGLDNVLQGCNPATQNV